MKPTRGCGSSGTEGEGPQGAVGLLISIAFVFLFVSIFLPEGARNWFWTLFIAVEIGAAVFYLVAARRSRSDAERLRTELHRTTRKTEHIV